MTYYPSRSSKKKISMTKIQTFSVREIISTMLCQYFCNHEFLFRADELMIYLDITDLMIYLDTTGLLRLLTHLPLDKMATILQKKFLNTFSPMKTYELHTIFH